MAEPWKTEAGVTLKARRWQLSLHSTESARVVLSGPRAEIALESGCSRNMLQRLRAPEGWEDELTARRERRLVAEKSGTKH